MLLVGWRIEGELGRELGSSRDKIVLVFSWLGDRIGWKVVGSKDGAENRWENCFREGSSGNNSLILASKLFICTRSPYRDSYSCKKAKMGLAFATFFGFEASLRTVVSKTARASINDTLVELFTEMMRKLTYS